MRARYLAFRILMIIPVLFVASILAFSLARLAPGDITMTLLGPWATESDREGLRRELGLDKPPYIQYIIWLGRTLHGDLGRSVEMRSPVAVILVEKYKNSLSLGLSSFILAFSGGFAVGVVSATRERTAIDRIALTATTFLSTMPVFWLALVLIFVFSMKLHLLPTGGMSPLEGGGNVLTLLQHLILPAVTTALVPGAIIARSTRSAVIEALQQDFVVVARSKGLSDSLVLTRHVLKFAFPGVLYVAGLQLAYLFGGTEILTEIVYSWPGIGLQTYNAVVSRDMPMIQGIILLIATVSVIVNLSVEVVHTLIDPRVVLE